MQALLLVGADERVADAMTLPPEGSREFRADQWPNRHAASTARGSSAASTLLWWAIAEGVGDGCSSTPKDPDDGSAVATAAAFRSPSTWRSAVSRCPCRMWQRTRPTCSWNGLCTSAAEEV